MSYHKRETKLLRFEILRLLCGVILVWLGTIHGIAAEELNTTSLDGGFVQFFLNTDTEHAPPADTVAKAVRIYYRVNRTEIERNYMDNAYALNIIDQLFTNTSLEEKDFIVITGGASPEGGLSNNQFLATERALSLKNYIKQKHPQIKDKQIVIRSDEEDWEGLTAMVKNDNEVPNREELLGILHSNLSRERQKVNIKKLNGGKSYKYILTHILPYLRGSSTGAIYSKKEELLVRTDTVIIYRYDTVYIEKEVVRIDTVYPERMTKRGKGRFVMAVKTNLLYDAALLPNLAIEIPFGHNYNWSAEIEGNWSWWNTNAGSYRYHRIQMAGASLRRWFGNKTGRPLNGWYVGAYTYGGTYDVRLFTRKNSDKGQLSNWSYSGGLTAGYAMRIAKRFNLEFGLSAGYFGGKYYKYDVSDCQGCTFPKRSTHNRNYLGPTKASVSLVWLIGNFKQDKRKEEKR